MSRPGEQRKIIEDETSELFLMMSRGRATHSVDERMEACMMYIAEGNMKAVERATGVSYNTLKDWKESTWWPLATALCHKKKDKELEHKLSRILHNTIGELQDRISNGDWVVDKNGDKSRKPITARELATIANTVYDKRALTRGEATSMVMKQDSQKDKLKALESKFNDFSRQLKEKEIETIEVIYNA